MTRFLAVRDFDRLQHYHDRALRWIKLYLDLLDDWEFQRLPDASKFHLIGLMLLAGRQGNRLPDDAQYLAQKIGANTNINLDMFLRAGFLIPLKRKRTKRDAASRTVAEMEQPASPDKREEKKRSEGRTSEVECIPQESGKDEGPGEGEERESLAQELLRQAQETAKRRQELGERIVRDLDPRQEVQYRDWVPQTAPSANEESNRRKSECKPVRTETNRRRKHVLNIHLGASIPFSHRRPGSLYDPCPPAPVVGALFHRQNFTEVGKWLHLYRVSGHQFQKDRILWSLEQSVLTQ